MIGSGSQQSRAERLIAAGRMVLAAFALWLDPTEPAGYVVTAYILLAGYLCYSTVLALVLWRMDFAWPRSAVVIHAFDLLIFAVFMFLTTAPPARFFAFFAFSLASASLRWQWRGTICTAAIALGIDMAVFLYPADLPRSPEFDINHLVFRIGYLLAVAMLLGYLCAYGHKQRGQLSSLAEWPRTIPEEIYPLVSEILQRSSSLFAAPRTLLLWKEEEEPLLHTASWSLGQFHHSLESPETFGALVAEPLAGENFLCRDSLAPKPLVIHSSPTGFKRWQGMPLHPELQRRFSIKSVLSLALQSESVSGRLFALDGEQMASDDLVLGRIVSHETSCNLDQFYLHKRLRHTAAVEERIRLARDLHDGLLQSLTGAALQLDAAHQLMEREPQTARERLLDIQKLISAEQQSLRSHIQQLKPPYSSLPEWDGNLAQRLKELAERIERQWGLQAGIDVSLDQSPLPWTMAQGVYFIIHEAMINAARHAKASSIQAEISSTDHQLRIVVTDNGHGFPFAGRHDHAALTETNLGPVILRERVSSLGGRMAIESGKTGARLEIALPIPEKMS
jgi:signal transduction histidine kinase